MISKKSLSYLRTTFVKNLASDDLLEYFFVSAISSLLIIRIFLAISPIKEISGGDFHIAHMLWGGLFMMISIFMFIIFINSESKVLASIFGGIGFGTFIDELGKFITADNDYFYQPTVGLIYIIFVLIYLFIKYVESQTEYSDKTYAANAVEGLKELVISDFEQDEKHSSLIYIDKIKNKDEVLNVIKDLISKAKVKNEQLSLYTTVKRFLFSIYLKAIKIKMLIKLLLIFFILNNFFSFLLMFYLLIFERREIDTFTEYGYLFSVFLSGIVILLGVFNYWKNDKFNLYKNLSRATLINLLLTQYFLFVLDQFQALLNLTVFILVYVVLKYSINAEQKVIYTKSDS
jgi:hypothetical protein